MELLTTGELAGRCGVSADTIRHYEKQGLLSAASRTDGGYRQFAVDSVERVQVIRHAIRIGFTIGELRKILRRRASGEAPCRNVHALAAGKLVALDDEIAQMTRLRAQLAATLYDWDQRLAGRETGSPAYLLDSLILKENHHEESGTAVRTDGLDAAARGRLSTSRRARRR